MVVILAGDIFNGILFNENGIIPIQISLKYVPRSPIDNKSALVQVMAWRPTGDKSLPGPVITQFNEAYMRHNGRWGKFNDTKIEQALVFRYTSADKHGLSTLKTHEISSTILNDGVLPNSEK